MAKKRKVKRRPGRPTNMLTKRLLKRIREMAAQGLTQNQMSDVLGVHHVTFSRWKDDVNFTKNFSMGLAMGLQRRLNRIAKAASKGSWQADTWWIERKFPADWGRRIVEHVGEAGGPMQFAILVGKAELPEPADNVVELEPQKRIEGA